MKTRLLTDCASDLSNELLESLDVGVVRFFMHLDTGSFTDLYEITAANVIEYYANNGTKIISEEPTAEDYSKIFTRELKKYENVIHFSISSKISDAYSRACQGRDLLDEESASHVFVIDTLSISSAIGLLIERASKMNREGKSAQEIVNEMHDMIPRIDTNFITSNADYLAINGRVKQWISDVCKALQLRAVFRMYDGDLRPCRFEFGSRERYIRRYIKHELKHPDRIDDGVVFITHSSSSKEELRMVTQTVQSIVPFKKVYTCKTSATVTCNCGAGAIGVLFLYKK